MCLGPSSRSERSRGELEEKERGGSEVEAVGWPLTASGERRRRECFTGDVIWSLRAMFVG